MSAIQDHKDLMASVDEAARQERPRPARWFNSLGDEVDLSTIDREYALNILMLYMPRKARQGWTGEDFRSDPLTQTLCDRLLNGRDRDGSDSLRVAAYNRRNAARGLSFRAGRR